MRMRHILRNSLDHVTGLHGFAALSVSFALLTLTACGILDGGGPGSCERPTEFQTQTSSPNLIYGEATSNGYVATGVNSDSKWAVSRSTDSGRTWTAIDSYALVTGSLAMGRSIAQSSSLLYACGYAKDATGTVNTHWITRVSSDGGASWKTVDDYVLANDEDAQCDRLVVLGSDVIASGAAKTGGNKHWIVRKAALGSETWTTVKDAANRGNSDYLGFFVHGTSLIAALDLSSRWQTFRSSDAGATWTSVDDYELETGQAAAASSGISTGSAIYVAGLGNDTVGTGNSHWIVRKSTDNGTTWSTIDDYVMTTDQNTEASGIAFAGSSIYVAGLANASGLAHAVVRRSTDGGATWKLVDDYFKNPPGQGSFYYAFFAIEYGLFGLVISQPSYSLLDFRVWPCVNR